MKKTLLALSAAAIALSGMAASPKQTQKLSLRNHDRSVQLKSDINHMRPGSSRMMKAPAKAFSSADVITSVEGKVQDMAVTGTGYFSFYEYVFKYENEVSASQVVYGENDEVYFLDILPYAAADSYVKGIRNGDKIEISLPQPVLYYDDYGYGYQLCMLDYEEETSEDGEVSGWYYMNDVDSVTVSVAEDGSMMIEGISESRILGLAYTDDSEWIGYGAMDLSMAPFNEAKVTPPSDFEVSDGFWLNGLDGYALPVNWAQGYDEMYFQGLGSYMPNGWMMGTVEYGDDAATISIAQNQYMGIAAGSFIYTKCVSFLEFDEYGEVVSGALLPDDYKYELVWNYEDNTIVSKDPDVYLVLNFGKDEVAPLDNMKDIKLVHQDDFAGTPANPYGLTFDPSYYEDPYVPYGEFKFCVPAVSTEGDYLQADNLSYVLYVDGEEWEFDADEYELAENMVEIPWDFSVYFIYNFGGVLREVDFFVEGITTLGVQSVYRYNGEETRSEIVTLDLEADPDAVGTVNAGKKVASVKYYSLDGREMANPAAGIFVKRVTFEDGSVATYKKAIR